jgi:hypothetical protein
MGWAQLIIVRACCAVARTPRVAFAAIPRPGHQPRKGLERTDTSWDEYERKKG